MDNPLLMIVMWMLMILVNMMMLCSVILTTLIVAIHTMAMDCGEQESGTTPMEVEWELREGIKMNFIETGEHKLYDLIVDKAHLQQEDFSDVKYQMPVASYRLFS